MFKAIREYKLNGKTENTIKTYETMEQALAYARRYSTGKRFLRCRILKDGAWVYTLEKDGTETFQTDDESRIPVAPKKHETENQREASRECMELVLDLPPKSGSGDFETELCFQHEDGSTSTRSISHRTKKQAMAFASTTIANTGSFLDSITVRMRGIVRWIWKGRWIYRLPTPQERQLDETRKEMKL